MKTPLLTLFIILVYTVTFCSEKPPFLMHHYSEKIKRKKSNDSELEIRPKRKSYFPSRKKSDEALSKKESGKKAVIFIRKSKKEKMVSFVSQSYRFILDEFLSFKKLCKDFYRKHPSEALTELFDRCDKVFFKRERIIDALQRTLEDKAVEKEQWNEALEQYKVTIETLRCVLLHCNVWFLSNRLQLSSTIIYKILNQQYNERRSSKHVGYR